MEIKDKFQAYIGSSTSTSIIWNSLLFHTMTCVIISFCALFYQTQNVSAFILSAVTVKLESNNKADYS